MEDIQAMKKVVIVGAGVSGLTMASLLSARGYRIEVYEGRSDPRLKYLENRSINFTITKRGMEVLKHLGLEQITLSKAVRLNERSIHLSTGSNYSQKYGSEHEEVLHAITRRDLNIILLEFAEVQPNVTVFFNRKCLAVDKTSVRVLLEDLVQGEQFSVDADFIVGADGVFSCVRQSIQKGERADYRQWFFDWGYKELTLPAPAEHSASLQTDALHIWSRPNGLMVGIPNLDGSFNCTLLLPLQGEAGFSSLQSNDEISTYFMQHFPEIAARMPCLVEDFNSSETHGFVSMTTSFWFYQNHVILVGDACHTVFPFYGQGMNAALEDCLILDGCIGECQGDLRAAFRKFHELRKPDTDALTELSTNHFYYLRDRSGSSFAAARNRIEALLVRALPQLWVSEYSLVSHTSRPYREILNRVKKQNRLWKYFGLFIPEAIIGSLIHFIRLAKAFAHQRRQGAGQELKIEELRVPARSKVDLQ